MNNKNKKIFYSAMILGLSLLFIGSVYKFLAGRFYEQDMWWYVASIYHDTSGMSFGELFSYIVKPTQFFYPLPYFKLVPIILMSFFGPQMKFFILPSLFIFAATAFSLFYLFQKLGFELRVCVFSSILFLLSFIHFHAYAWPVALQHILTVFFTSCILAFYLAVNSGTHSGRKHFYYLMAILFAFLSSFGRSTILIVPVLVFLHIVFCSANGSERLRKYNIWLPLFAVYLIYPVIVMKYIGDDALTFISAQYRLPFNLPVLFLIGAAMLAVIEVFLVLFRNKQQLLTRRQLYFFFALAFLFLAARNIRNILLPYNILRPYMAFLQTIFMPIETALQTNSTQPYYYLFLWQNAPLFVLVLFSSLIFFKQVLGKKPEMILLPIGWYLFGFIRLNLESVMPSRYFIYVTPILSLVLASSAVYIYDLLSTKMHLKSGIRKLILGSLFVCFVVQSMAGIALALWRGKFVNTFMLYDYIRVADTLKQNLPKTADPQTIYISNILPISELAGKPLSNDYYNFRFLLAQVFNDRRMLGVKINQPAGMEAGKYVYSVNNGRVYDRHGQDLDKYAGLMAKARLYLRQKDFTQAAEFVQAALDERPFLLNYTLSGKYDLINIKYLCGNLSLFEWLRLIKLYYASAQSEEDSEKLTYISSIVNRELDDYVLAIFYKAYLEYLSGNKTQSLFWFNKIVYFDDDRDRVLAKLRQDAWVENGKDKDEFLAFMNTKLWFWYRDSNYVKNYRFRFQMFLFELLLDRPLFYKKTLVQD